MDEAHYDTPWEYIQRNPTLPLKFVRPHSESPESSVKAFAKNSLNDVQDEPDLSAKKRHSSRKAQGSQRDLFHTASDNIQVGVADQKNSLASKIDRRTASIEHERKRLKLHLGRFGGFVSKKERLCEDDLIHKIMDRSEAERHLMDYCIGSFLIRRRDSNNLALSIKAVKSILHIKIEYRDNRWVLGEGPSFSTVLAIVNYYRTHELPIRGAERMILSSPIPVSSRCSNMKK